MDLNSDDPNDYPKPDINDINAYVLLELLLVRFYEYSRPRDDKTRKGIRINLDIEKKLLRECIEADFARLEGIPHFCVIVG